MKNRKIINRKIINRMVRDILWRLSQILLLLCGSVLLVASVFVDEGGFEHAVIGFLVGILAQCFDIGNTLKSIKLKMENNGKN